MKNRLKNCLLTPNCEVVDSSRSPHETGEPPKANWQLLPFGGWGANLIEKGLLPTLVT